MEQNLILLPRINLFNWKLNIKYLNFNWNKRMFWLERFKRISKYQI